MPTFDESEQPAQHPAAGNAPQTEPPPTEQVPTEQLSNAEPVTPGGSLASDAWSASSGTPPAVPPPLLPTPTTSIAPPAASGFSADPSGVVPPAPPALEQPKKKSSAGRLAAVVAVGGAAIGAILVKFVLPLVLVGAVGQVFDSAFGGPYGRLPGDVRSGFEKRLDTAFGKTLDGQTDSAKTSRVQSAVKSGLSRLDDGSITTNFQLTTKAINAVDVPSCAAVSRAIVSGAEPPEAATNAMINTLSDSDLRQWFEIRIAAVEADLRNSPPQIAITDAQVDPLYQKLFTIMQANNITVIGKLAQGGTVEDAELCTAIRDLYTSVQGLSADEALLFARYDVSP